MSSPAFNDPGLMLEMLRQSKTIAVVGISDRQDRPSFQVAQYLARHYEIIPVNPKLETWLGRKCYPSLSAIPTNVQIDLVDIFRRSEDVLPVVEEAVARGAKYIWLQQGIANPQAAELAKKAGIGIIMDACLLVEHARH